MSPTAQELKKSNLKSQNGEIDYKKVNINIGKPNLFLKMKNIFFQLWEESQSENSRLRTEMNGIRSDLDTTRHQLEAAIQVIF